MIINTLSLSCFQRTLYEFDIEGDGSFQVGVLLLSPRQVPHQDGRRCLHSPKQTTLGDRKHTAQS